MGVWVPPLLSTAVAGTASPEVMRPGDLSLTLSGCMGPAPLLGNTIELVLMVETQVGQPGGCGCDSRTADAAPHSLQPL